MTARTCLTIAALVLLGADAKDDAKKDLDKLQGNWTSVSYTVGGKAWGEAERKTLKLTVKGALSTLVVGEQSATGTYKLDPSKKPKELDIAVTAGSQRGQAKLAIYEIDGDALRICLHPDGKERPKEFASKAGTGTTLEVWKRVP